MGGEGDAGLGGTDGANGRSVIHGMPLPAALDGGNAVDPAEVHDARSSLQVDSTASGAGERLDAMGDSSTGVAPIRIACGQTAPVTDALGNIWSADEDYVGGTALVSTTAVSGTASPALYYGQRYGASSTPFHYTIVVPAGTYSVLLKFDETYFTGDAGTGQRLFNVSINGSAVLEDFDIYAAAGSNLFAAVDKTFTVTVGSEHVVTIELDPVVQDPRIDAIQITQGEPADGDDAGHNGDAAASLPTTASPMPVISRNVPAYASSGTVSSANDSSYDTQWRSNETTSSSTPSWLAYDLSSVPPAQRGQVDVAWYNANGGYDEYDTFVGSSACTPPACVAFNEPSDYTLEGNAAAGGSLPAGGWVTLVTVTGNTRISRRHALSLSGYNWLRLNVTAVNGSAGNENTAVNLDVHDAAQGVTDSWIFFGDSITAFALRNDGAGISASSFAELINAANPSYFPAQEGAGEGGWTSATPLTTTAPSGTETIFDDWLSTFPGRFVCLSYGTNDNTEAANDATPTYNNFVTMIGKVTAAGKIPCIPHVPWAEDAAHQTNAQLINAKIDQIYAEYPSVVRGPDLYSVLEGQTTLYQDNLHPNPQGREVYRQASATAMLAEVY
jgi:Malectin domain/GDSL-like Lipase/Acylhydrolase family